MMHMAGTMSRPIKTQDNKNIAKHGYNVRSRLENKYYYIYITS